MTLPTRATRVDYPAGSVTTAATVLHVEPLPHGRVGVVLDATSAHPVDAGWPDQGPDRGVIVSGPLELPVVDCLVAATDGSALYLGREVPVPKGTDGWAFVVVHVVADSASLAEGDAVVVTVDPLFRHRTSAGHTACHLASLALNRAVADRWKKDVRADGLGQPDFDGVANDVSLIRENGSTDTYRLGKSLRKKGFVTDGLVESLAQVQQAINTTLAAWLATNAPVRVERSADGLTDRREWVCELPDGTARIPCGGTHLNSLGELGEEGGLTVVLSTADADGTTVLTMDTSVGASA
ncbi:metal-dependent hydrolase [Glaciibacter sp. 2TAF33]|uniref:metal-dependent hydrolase n=1 Tax=Glaciibacter sp. 2TAF33 TaxID=3233015 RepID=UPI003F904E64